jgi:hypothetical protein
VDRGCGVHPNVFAYVLVSTVVGCLVLFTTFLLKFECKRKSARRRRAIAPVNMETAPRTDSSDRKNRTTSSSQKEWVFKCKIKDEFNSILFTCQSSNELFNVTLYVKIQTASSSSRWYDSESKYFFNSSHTKELNFIHNLKRHERRCEAGVWFLDFIYFIFILNLLI